MGSYRLLETDSTQQCFICRLRGAINVVLRLFPEIVINQSCMEE